MYLELMLAKVERIISNFIMLVICNRNSDFSFIEKYFFLKIALAMSICLQELQTSALKTNKLTLQGLFLKTNKIKFGQRCLFT